MKKTIIGLVGETGSGKDTVANYLKKKYNAKLMRFADPIKETLSIYFDKLSKEDQAWLYMVFKDRFGEDILSRAMRKRVDDEDGFIVINGLRMPTDFDFIKEFDEAKVLYVTASQEMRWRRVTSRGEKSDDDISFKDFKNLDKKPTEVHIAEIGKRADFTIANERDLKYLLDEAESFVQSLSASLIGRDKKVVDLDRMEHEDIESEVKGVSPQLVGF